MPKQELNEIRESKVVSIKRNEKEDYTPKDKSGNAMGTLKGFDITFENGDEGITRSSKETPRFKEGESAQYKTEILTSEKNPDWQKKIFKYYDPKPQKGSGSLWNDPVFRKRDTYLKSLDISSNIILKLQKEKEANEEAFYSIASQVYQTVLSKAENDKSKEKLMIDAFYSALMCQDIAIFTCKSTKEVINLAIKFFNELLKIEN